MLYEENAGRNIWRGLSPARLSVLIKPELAGVADLSYPAPPRRLSKASAFNLLSPIPPSILSRPTVNFLVAPERISRDRLSMLRFRGSARMIDDRGNQMREIDIWTR